MTEVLSVIVPMFNATDTVDKCLSAISQQTFVKFRVIVVDDGSTDDSYSKAVAWQQRDQRFTVLKNTSTVHGASKARNLGLGVVDTPYVTFVDADDWIEPFHFKNMVTGIEKGNICFVPASLANNHVLKKRINKAKITKNRMIMKVMGDNEFSGYSCNKIFKMNVIKENNIEFQTSLKMSEDLAFVIDYLGYCKSGTIIFSPESYHYIKHLNSISMMYNFNTEDLFSELHALRYIKKSLNLRDVRINRAYKVHMAMVYNTLLKKCYANREQHHFSKLTRLLRIKNFKLLGYCYFSHNISIHEKLAITSSILFPGVVLWMKNKFKN